MNSKLYDVLKYIYFFIFPAIYFLWGVIYVVWNIPHGEAILITIGAVQTAYGIALGLSNVSYNKKIGAINNGNCEKPENNNG